MTEEVELQVLDGLHEGARCPVEDGTLVGADLSCDIVLGDAGIAPQAARIRVGPAGWALVPMAELPEQESPTLAFDTVAALGPVRLTISRTASADVASETMPSPEQASDVDLADGADRPGPSMGTGTPTAMRKSMRSRRPGQSLPAAAAVLAVLVFGGAAVAAFLPPGLRIAVPTRHGAPEAVPSLAQVQRIVRQLGLEGRVSAGRGPGRAVTVSGWVQDDGQERRLAEALTTVAPLPTMRVRNTARVAQRIKALLQDMDARVLLDTEQSGPPRLRAIAVSEGERATVLQRMQPYRSDVAVEPEALITAPAACRALREVAMQAGLRDLSLAWRAGSIHVKAADLGVAERRRLEDVVSSQNRNYLGVFSLEPATPAPDAALPFRIHSVIGGPQPWLILDDGTKLLVGGTHRSYRLKAIEDGSVVFDGPRVAVVPR